MIKVVAILPWVFAVSTMQPTPVSWGPKLFLEQIRVGEDRNETKDWELIVSLRSVSSDNGKIDAKIRKAIDEKDHEKIIYVGGSENCSTAQLVEMINKKKVKYARDGNLITLKTPQKVIWNITYARSYFDGNAEILDAQLYYWVIPRDTVKLLVTWDVKTDKALAVEVYGSRATSSAMLLRSTTDDRFSRDFLGRNGELQGIIQLQKSKPGILKRGSLHMGELENLPEDRILWKWRVVSDNSGN